MRDFEQLVAATLNHNARIREANGLIGKLKKDAASTNEAVVEQERRALRNSQIRQESRVQELCGALISSREERARLTGEKSQDLEFSTC